MLCAQCGHESRDGAKFCGGCGRSTSAELTCAACGHGNPAGQRFCDECGQRLGTRPSAEPVGRPATPLPAAFAGGRYRVRKLLGEGARKRVYLAHDTRLDREVAFAAIKADGLDDSGRGRVQREAQSMGRLGDHPNIVTVFDVGDDGGQPYIVSQYMAGGDLLARMRETDDHRLPLDEVLGIGEQICSALEHAHARGIVHRDLKPGNVWLTQDGHAQLGDFGLAIDLDGTRLTQEGMMLGTLAYMSPEQALARPPDARSDLYSLGAMLYEMVAGRPPFLGDSAIAVVSQHVNTAPVAPSWHDRTIPRSLDALILRLLAKDAGERPESATAVRLELERIHESSMEQEAVASDELPTGIEGVPWGRFFGRREELDQLKRSLDQALSGRGGVVMLVGEPGIGKSRLAEEFAVYAKMRGARFLTGRCYEGEGAVPYLPFVEALRPYVRELDDARLRAELGAGAPEVATLVSELRQRFPDLPDSPPLEPDEERIRLFSGVTAFLENASRASPLVLFLDDIHWADEPSLGLLRYLARQVPRQRILLLAAYRDVELDRTHPLAEVIATLRRERSYERVLLRGLPESDILSLLTAAGEEGEPDAGRQALAAALHRETEGNPFFVREVLSHLIEEGRLYRSEGRWTSDVSSITELGIPEGVREVVGRRLSRLSGACNRLLTLASTLTAGFTWEVLCAISEEDESATLERLEEALAARVVEERKGDGAGAYDFSHALIRQTLYGELSTPRRVLLHRQIGEALEALHADDLEPHLAELAHHFWQAAPGSDALKAADYSARAGARAVKLLAWEEAAGHYERALQALDLGGSDDDTSRFELLDALVSTCLSAELNERAIGHVEEAVRVAERAGDAERLARAAVLYAETMRFGANQGQRRELPVIDRALAALPAGDDPLRARLWCARHGALMIGASAAEREEMAALARDAKAMAERLGDPEAEARSLQALHSQLLFLGSAHTEERLEVVREWIRAEERAGSRRGRVFAAQSHVAALAELGDMAAAEREAPALIALAESIRTPMADFARTAWRASVALLRGRAEEAETHVLEQIARVDRMTHVGSQNVLRGQVYNLRLHQGRLEELEAPLLEALEGLPGRDPVLPASLALVYWLTGRPEESRQWYERYWEHDRRDLGWSDTKLTTLGIAAQLAFFLDDAPRAQALYDELLPCEQRQIVMSAGFALQGSAARPLGMLATVLGRYDDAERHFEQALAFDRRIDAPPWIARTQLAYAAMLVRRDGPGDRARANALLNEAMRTADELRMPYELEMGLALRMELQGVPSAELQSSIEVVADAVESRRPVLATHAAPDGTVTLMFSDMEGFTAMTERLGDLKAREVIRAHNAIVREQLAAHHGHEVELQGDGFLLAFGSARRAVHCAIAFQRAFEAYSREHADEPICVRIGLHTGEALQDADKFFGKCVIVASRIAAQAAPGEILVSSLLKQLTESTGDLRFGGERELSLKGISEPQRVHAVEWR